MDWANRSPNYVKFLTDRSAKFCSIPGRGVSAACREAYERTCKELCDREGHIFSGWQEKRRLGWNDDPNPRKRGYRLYPAGKWEQYCMRCGETREDLTKPSYRETSEYRDDYCKELGHSYTKWHEIISSRWNEDIKCWEDYPSGEWEKICTKCGTTVTTKTKPSPEEIYDKASHNTCIEMARQAQLLNKAFWNRFKK